MENININELLSTGKDCTLELTGIITTKIEIKNANIKETKNMIEIYNQENNEKQVKLLKHQIMKVEKENNNYILKFDMLQNVKIIAN